MTAHRPNLRRGVTLGLLCLLAACARGGDDPVAEPASYRDRSVPISSKALFDPAEYMGLWHEVARFPTPFESGCATATFEFAPGEGGSYSVRHTCLDADGTPNRTLDGTARVTGPGRLTVDFADVAFVASEFWILWTDETYRTAVIGTPTGQAGWILNREPAIPADRMTAAREILDFNGYDLARLQTAG